MTEAEWNACTDPTPMLEFLRGKVGDRKLRLFAVACYRQIWPTETEARIQTDARLNVAIKSVDNFIEGSATRGEVKKWWKLIRRAKRPGASSFIYAPSAKVEDILRVIGIC